MAVTTPYERVKTARSAKRPTGLDYIRGIFTDFIEMHGDRRYGDDGAIVGGVARLDGKPVTVIAIEKGHTTKERTARTFGAPHPEGYRKALRLMKQAEKFHRPVICLIDTSGAHCGIGAEEAGKRRVFRHFSRGLCQYSLERRRKSGRSGPKFEINRPGRIDTFGN